MLRPEWHLWQTQGSVPSWHNQIRLRCYRPCHWCCIIPSQKQPSATAHDRFIRSRPRKSPAIRYSPVLWESDEMMSVLSARSCFHGRNHLPCRSPTSSLLIHGPFLLVLWRCFFPLPLPPKTSQLSSIICHVYLQSRLPPLRHQQSIQFRDNRCHSSHQAILFSSCSLPSSSKSTALFPQNTTILLLSLVLLPFRDSGDDQLCANTHKESWNHEQYVPLLLSNLFAHLRCCSEFKSCSGIEGVVNADCGYFKSVSFFLTLSNPYLLYLSTRISSKSDNESETETEAEPESCSRSVADVGFSSRYPLLLFSFPASSFAYTSACLRIHGAQNMNHSKYKLKITLLHHILVVHFLTHRRRGESILNHCSVSSFSVLEKACDHWPPQSIPCLWKSPQHFVSFISRMREGMMIFE